MKRKIVPIPETHLHGAMTIESIVPNPFVGDFGIQVASDGRVWICLDGQAFIRFVPR